LAQAASKPWPLHPKSPEKSVENTASIIMCRALFATAIAFPASLHCFTDLILHNRFLQPPQQGLCVVEKKAQILRTKRVRRTAKSTDIAPPGFSIVKRRLDKNAYIHGGSRLVPKPYPIT
jgi:hypothetical protein